jgi:hypothetical protein
VTIALSRGFYSKGIFLKALHLATRKRLASIHELPRRGVFSETGFPASRVFESWINTSSISAFDPCVNS